MQKDKKCIENKNDLYIIFIKQFLMPLGYAEYELVSTCTIHARFTA